jgi:hypothetical protein
MKCFIRIKEMHLCIHVLDPGNYVKIIPINDLTIGIAKNFIKKNNLQPSPACYKQFTWLEGINNATDQRTSMR